jgi:hypothetical protein
MPRPVRAVLGASLLALVLTSSHAGAAPDTGYDQVRSVANCVQRATQAFHAGRRECRANHPRREEREAKLACYEETTRQFFADFEGCYDLAESYE